MKNWALNSFLFAFLTLVKITFIYATPLDDYVKQYDPHYHWEITAVEETLEAKIYTLTLTSQKWRSSDEVDNPIWKHQLTIVVPSGSLASNTALLAIGSGMQDGTETVYALDKLPLLELALKTHRIVCEITHVPNQYIKFSDEKDPRYIEKGRKEDALVAYSWDKYLVTEDPTWPLRMPMTKAVVKAMDASEELIHQKLSQNIDGFILIGLSKRGWAAWTTAAVDNRVRGIIPVVIDLLNLKTSFIRHYMAYGSWSLAIRDYGDINLFERWNGDAFDRLMKMIEPFEYRERLTMPKYIINASGDEFFLPDSSTLYFNSLPGIKHLLYLPNTGHRVSVSRITETIIAYVNLLANNEGLPTASWSLNEEKQLIVEASKKPLKATLWQAHNPDSRDFRITSIGGRWTSTALTLDKNGKYSAPLNTPEMGWSAFFVELDFNSPNGEIFKVSTEVFILPDVFPFLDIWSNSDGSSAQTLVE